MSDDPLGCRYLHGYSPDEQRRLIEQAEYWRDDLILPDLPYRPGERLLDVGCGCGAVLGVIASAHPGLRLAGIDREPAQIAAARAHLAPLGHPAADLRQGDAARMPWPDASFEHATMMWFVEHVPTIVPILREVRRVLVPGGSLTIHETEYETYQVWPQHEDWEHVVAALFRHFEVHGQPHAGRRLGTLLVEAGFARVESRMMGVHRFAQPGCDALRRHAEYTAGYIEPAIPELVDLGFDESRLRRGLAHLRGLHEHPHGAFTQQVFRARGWAAATDTGSGSRS